MAVQLIPHVKFDPDRPLLITLTPRALLTREAFVQLQAAVDLFVRFSAAGGLSELGSPLRPATTLTGTSVEVAFDALPNDPLVLGVIGRMLLHVEDWSTVSVAGTPAQRPTRALEPLPLAIERVPRLRQPLRVKSEIAPGMSWYCIELTRLAEWAQNELDALEACAQLWMEVCRAGGLAEVGADLVVTPGNVGMDEPQVGSEFWSAQIGATDIHPGAISSLVNLFDQAARTVAPFDTISIT